MLFHEALRDSFSSFIGKQCCDVQQLDDEIKHVATLMKEAAEAFLPHYKYKKVSRFKDST